MINYTLLIQALLLGWFITQFEPLQWFISKLQTSGILPQNITKYLSCLKCCSFWASLVYGGFKLELSIETLVFTSILASLLAWLWSNTIIKWITQIKQYI